MSPNWLLLVVYEDEAARERAVQFCNSLVDRFWKDLSFDISWCVSSELLDPAGTKKAGENANQAQFIIVATGASGSLSPHVNLWLEMALHDRGEREGALVGLTADISQSEEAMATQLYLRRLAHESGLDYLTGVPQGLPHEIPESIESYNLRAQQVTSVLATILHRSILPRVL
jgi:hypothetical protein